MEKATSDVAFYYRGDGGIEPSSEKIFKLLTTSFVNF